MSIDTRLLHYARFSKHTGEKWNKKALGIARRKATAPSYIQVRYQTTPFSAVNRVDAERPGIREINRPTGDSNATEIQHEMLSN